MTDILAQRDSTGIYYEPYERDFKLCIHEEPDVQGRNERYEFRCDSQLSCCGRVCCVPAAAAGAGTILGLPWWLFLLLPLLLLLLLLAALAYLLYRLCRKKRGEKEVVKRSTRTSRHATRPYQSEAGYRSIDRAGDDRGGGLLRQSDVEAEPNGHAKLVDDQRIESGFDRPYRRSFHEEETFEEEFHEEIEMDLPSLPLPKKEELKPLVYPKSPPASLPPTRRVVMPSPLEEYDVPTPQPIRAVERELPGSHQSLTTMCRQSESPQRAQHAFYRPVLPDQVEELQLNMPHRVQPQFGDTQELLGRGMQPVPKSVDIAEPLRAEIMYVRPSFDNIPSY
uniref:CX domain-containing protein n=1 Tax=Globodera rostochiensis TaxID=31243 RepID=A0A914HN59_GLORO